MDRTMTKAKWHEAYSWLRWLRRARRIAKGELIDG